MSDFAFREPGILQDDELTLVIAQMIPADPSKGYVPAYEFKVTVHGEEAGRIVLRAQNTPLLELVGGHVGYNIKEKFRGHHYAARACALILSLARAHGFRELWITCNPDNWASRKTAEYLGAELVNIVDVPENNDMYQRGERVKCRYCLDLELD